MRWEALFADLEATVEGVRLQEHEAEVAEQARAEYAAVRLIDRLRVRSGRSLACELVDGRRLDGVVRETGADWLLLQVAPAEVLVPVRALTAVTRSATDTSGVSGSAVRSVARSMTGSATGGAVSVAPRAGLGESLGLSAVLRGLSVRRVPVRLALPGSRMLAGTIDRVGADHLELAVHDSQDPRRDSVVTGMRLVPFAAVLSVSLDPG
jgi:hypothetical protein